MTRILAALATLAATISGCIGGTTQEVGTSAVAFDPIPGSSDIPPVPVSFDLAACSEQVGVFPVPAEAFRSDLPEGFEFAYFDPGNQFASLAIVAYDCATTTGTGLAASELADIWGFLQVVPPEDYQQSGIRFYLINVGVFTSREDVAHRYTTWGMPIVSRVDVSWSMTETPAARLGAASAKNSEFGLSLRTVVPTPAAIASEGVARAFTVVEGTVTGYLDISEGKPGMAVETGGATLEVTESFLPIPAGTTEPGFGVHVWGPEYGYTYTYTTLVRATAQEMAQA